MKDKESFVLYRNQKQIFDALNDEQAGRLIKYIFEYVNDEDPVIEDPLLNIAFIPIKDSLKKDLKKWIEMRDRNVANARKRWGKEPKASEGMRPHATGSDGVPKNATAKSGVPKMPLLVTGNGIGNGNSNKKDNTDVLSKKRKHSFYDSPLLNIKDWAKLIPTSTGKYADADFEHYYESAELYSNSKGVKYQDWVSAIRNWMRNDMEKGSYKTAPGSRTGKKMIM